MPEKLAWTYSVQALAGPTVTGSGNMLVDSYVKLNVVVPNKKKLDVEIQPGTGSGLQILLIQPAKPSADLSYTAGSDTIVLDGPHVLIGSGAVSLLAASVGKLTFDNKADVDAEISILAGRDATP
ncbi:MAG: hypothetical protein ACRDKW_16125 [Actinomycetota bacterium]